MSPWQPGIQRPLQDRWATKYYLWALEVKTGWYYVQKWHWGNDWNCCESGCCGGFGGAIGKEVRSPTIQLPKERAKHCSCYWGFAAMWRSIIVWWRVGSWQCMVWVFPAIDDVKTLLKVFSTFIVSVTILVMQCLKKFHVHHLLTFTLKCLLWLKTTTTRTDRAYWALKIGGRLRNLVL